MTADKLKKKYHLSHDLFFKAMMSQPDVAKEFLEAYLPPEVLNHLDFSTLKQENCSFVSSVLTAHQGDMLYSLQFEGNAAYICVLIEHQSSEQKLMPLRVFIYSGLIMHHFADENRKKPLPLVIPIVLYHGKKPYHYSTDIREYIDAPPRLIQCFFNTPFHLIDLAATDDAVLLKQKVWAGIMQMALKHIRDTDALPFTEFLLSNLFKPLDQISHSEKIETVLSYLLNRANIKDTEVLKQLIHDCLDASLEDTVMTTMTQHWWQEGRQEGLQEGLQKGVQKGLQEGVQKGLQEGVQKGLQEGVQKGLQEGLQKGRQEMQHNFAKELLAEGESIEKIVRLTKLTVAEVTELAKNHESCH